MSLRLRLISLVVIVLAVSLVFGGAIACFSASRSVRTEMLSALVVAQQTIENAIDGLQTSRDPQRELENLVTSFKGNRHLRVFLFGDTRAIASPAVEESPFGRIPKWFVRLIRVVPATSQVPIPFADRSYQSVVIETDPHNEIVEVWNELSDSLITLALFCSLTILLIYLFIGRALQPLDRLAAALGQVGHGAYGTRIDVKTVPELSRLRGAFNRMAEQLAGMDLDNRRLNEQLLSLQEKERSELARDLHDEVSPFLFAINVDMASVARLAKEGSTAEILKHIPSVTDAVNHMQRQVRSMLGRLRPVGLTEFGLNAAIGNIVEFWRRRHPQIDYRVTISPNCEGLGEVIDSTIYRIVQEALSNAVRHGQPTMITVSVGRACHGEDSRHDVVIEVFDDGHGMDDSAGVGYGLIGMSERVRVMGGRLALSPRPGAGLAVKAVLPSPARQRELSSGSIEAGAQ
jgi:two-component system, NarL family, sensor histidine kinase UhpB